MAKDFLLAEKKVFDSVHGFIPFDDFERELIDSVSFQRLHYIHQLGVSYMVYPGATHTRFEHSLGVMHLASLMFEKICKSVRPDVFHFVPRKGSAEYLYWRRVLRMGALCHDLGHLPFSHVAEKDLLGNLGHENWTLKIIESKNLEPVWEKLRGHASYSEELFGRNIVEDIQKIAVGEASWQAIKGSPFSAWEKIVAEIISGPFFGADRIDYLLRDAKSTGVAYGLFDYHQLIETLRILPSPEPGSDEYLLGIDENGIESCEALLLARHFMHRRVYQYSSVKAYNFHLRRFMKAKYAEIALMSVEDYVKESDIQVVAALHLAAADPERVGHSDARCIVLRQERFRAIEVPHTITEKDLVAFKKGNGLKEEEMEWEFAPKGKALSLAFPVSFRHVVIEKAQDCSDLLAKIPEKESNWVYISPKYDLELLYLLEKGAPR